MRHCVYVLLQNYTAGGKKSVAALPEEKSESPTVLAVKDPDEKLILECHDNGVKALATIVSANSSATLSAVLRRC